MCDVHLYSNRELHNREILDGYLARALGIQIKGTLKDIDEQKYVLTLDYALKMLDIHERYQCGIPVIIEGETGVGKTALVDMLSILWNRPWLDTWEYSKDCIKEEITKLVSGKLMCMVFLIVLCMPKNPVLYHEIASCMISGQLLMAPCFLNCPLHVICGYQYAIIKYPWLECL